MRVLAGLVVVFFLSLMSVEARADGETPSKPESTAPSMATSGVLMFMGSYAASAAMALSYRDTDERVATKMFLPIVGPWLTFKDKHFDSDTMLTNRLVRATHADSCSGDGVVCPAELLFLPVAIVELGFIFIDPIAQATGVIMAFAGAAKSEPERPREHARGSAPEPPKVSVRPALVGTGPGMSLAITQW